MTSEEVLEAYGYGLRGDAILNHAGDDSGFTLTRNKKHCTVHAHGELYYAGPIKALGAWLDSYWRVK